MSEWLEPYSLSDFDFLGSYITRGKTQSVLISKYGTSITISNTLCDTIVGKNPSDLLRVKLYERGFARMFGKTMYEHHSAIVRPTLFMIDFTTRCNLACRYCFRELGKGREINHDRMIDICDYIVRYCRKYNVSGITLQGWGGEPLLSIDLIKECIRYLRFNGIRVHPIIQTNGLLLNTDRLQELRDEGFSVGVSIDGCRDVHDKHRRDTAGGPTYDLLKTRMCNPEENNLSAICVNTCHSLGKIKESLAALHDDFGITSAKFNIMHPSGGPLDTCALSEKQAAELIDELWNALIKMIEEDEGIYEPNIVDRIINLLSYGTDMCHSQGCLGGYSFISFDMDGRIYPCETIGSRENCIGSIYSDEDLIETIKESLDRVPFFKDRHSYACHDCEYEPYCKGGCYSSIVSRGYECCDLMECSVNKAIYGNIVRTILEDWEMINRLAMGRVRIQYP